MKTLIITALLTMTLFASPVDSSESKAKKKNQPTAMAVCQTVNGRRICCNEHSCWEILQ